MTSKKTPKPEEKPSAKELIDKLFTNYGIRVTKEEKNVAVQPKKQTPKDTRTLH